VLDSVTLSPILGAYKYATKGDGVSGEAQNDGRARDARLRLLIAIATLPLLVSCSSSSSVEYATDAFPSQSLADLLKDSKNRAPPAPNAVPPAAPATSAALPAPASARPAYEPPPASGAGPVNPPPATTTSVENNDPVAAAFPSVSLVDIVTGRKSGSQ
jgi:hypothetical protein